MLSLLGRIVDWTISTELLPLEYPKNAIVLYIYLEYKLAFLWKSTYHTTKLNPTGACETYLESNVVDFTDGKLGQWQRMLEGSLTYKVHLQPYIEYKMT